MDVGHPLDGVMEFWEEVMADMEATAAEYRESGWETDKLHPGNVTPLPAGATADGEFADGRTGLDVLVPGEEFERVEELVESGSFDGYDVFRAQQAGVVFLVVAMRDEAAGRAVVFPLYYRIDEARETLARVAERGKMRTWVRPLDDERRVVFVQESPDGLLPPEDD